MKKFFHSLPAPVPVLRDPRQVNRALQGCAGSTTGCQPVVPQASLEYHSATVLEKNGGQGRNRTADAGLFRAALYQLSYLAVGLRNWQYRKRALLCQIAGNKGFRTAAELAGAAGQSVKYRRKAGWKNPLTDNSQRV
jgi:hypothetical protein